MITWNRWFWCWPVREKDKSSVSIQLSTTYGREFATNREDLKLLLGGGRWGRQNMDIRCILDIFRVDVSTWKYNFGNQQHVHDRWLDDSCRIVNVLKEKILIDWVLSTPESRSWRVKEVQTKKSEYNLWRVIEESRNLHPRNQL